MGNLLTLGGTPFVAFGPSHITVLVIYFTGIVLFTIAFRKIMDNTYLYNTIRWILFILLLISEVSYQTWTAITGIWSLSEHMPLHLCGIAGITGMIALITYNKKLIQITFFIGLIPAFLALVTPELPYDFPHYRFWKFFVHHLSISWVSIFLVATSSVKVTLKSMLETYGYLLLFAFIIGVFFNPIMESNYLYLSHTPTASTPLDLLGNGFWYYFNLCLLAIVVFFIQLQVYKLFTRKKETPK
ncbi:TIGR02206 family membrane protein [Virgibacillus doumboii]|uniref:YwaF family protein n=1 Tax=Virgibacillus doumboii TaxID=2697503 RepID=UPI0013DF1E17|nr:TIGR02206 family membrane protein [Virgibacillus doumboii]